MDIGEWKEALTPMLFALGTGIAYLGLAAFSNTINDYQTLTSATYARALTAGTAGGITHIVFSTEWF